MKVNCRKIFGFRSKKKELLTLFLWDNASLNEINVFSLSELLPLASDGKSDLLEYVFYFRL